jgi:APA family basic amino acid/polyamine antiporter
LAVFGCVVLFLFLPMEAKLVFPIWAAIGLVFYFLYGYRNSHVARGLVTPAGGEELLGEIHSLVDYPEDCPRERD